MWVFCCGFDAWMPSFSELMPILLNVLIGVPQMLSNIQMILICIGVSRSSRADTYSM